MMQFNKKLKAINIKEIPGLQVFDIPVFGDDRGWFKENFQQEKFIQVGFDKNFFNGKGQNNISNSTQNVIRGMHAEPWDKFISVADNGEVLGVWLDLRAGDTFGNVFSCKINASIGVFVPKGVANGFQVLSDTVAYSYLVNDYWSLENKEKYQFVNLLDDKVRNFWTNLDKAIISEADKKHLFLKDL